ncbi:MAG: hypothetical protein GF408_05480 [Candidatus Omnitrophica bacterium]|nr:hypothetical protein [Candidatus Omnitrophota bacterium]
MKFKLRRYFIYYLLRAGFFLLGLIPLKVSLSVAAFLGRRAAKIASGYTAIAVDNLDKALGEDPERNARIAEKVFVNLAKNGAEWIKLSMMDPSRIGEVVTEAEGLENLDAVLEKGKGALVLGFHFGNWELLGLYLKQKGYSGALVAKRIYFHKYNELLENLRGRYGAPVIYRDESPRKMLKELVSGRILGIVPDQDVESVDGEFVEFFGRPAYTPTAPVKLAIAAGTQIVPIFIVRKEDNTHKMIVETPIDAASRDNTGQNVKELTQKWTTVLEDYVRKYPDQWVWIHKRWKTRPSGNSGKTAAAGAEI